MYLKKLLVLPPLFLTLVVKTTIKFHFLVLLPNPKNQKLKVENKQTNKKQIEGEKYMCKVEDKKDLDTSRRHIPVVFKNITIKILVLNVDYCLNSEQRKKGVPYQSNTKY